MSRHGSTGPRIVVAMIAGEGTAGLIQAALDSVASVADGVAVVASGGVDINRAVMAWNRGASVSWTVRERPWTGSYADARNAALDCAEVMYLSRRRYHGLSAWALMLDTDERALVHDPDGLRAYLDALDPRVRVVVVYADDGSHGRERFFRLPAEPRWIGRTHEAYPVDAGEQATAPREFVTWTELPKSAEQIAGKHTRDLAALEIECAERPDDPRWHLYRGQTLAALGRRDDAIAAFLAGSRGGTEDAALSCHRAAVLLIDAGRADEALEACARGMLIHAGIAELPYAAALASLALGRPDQAVRWARIAQVHAGPSGRVSFIDPHATGPGPALVLAQAEAMMRAGARS